MNVNACGRSTSAKLIAVITLGLATTMLELSLAPNLVAQGGITAPPPGSLQEHFFDANGVRIRFVEQGQGPVVVLIHGYLGSAERHWIDSGVMAALAKGYRVVALDCRGHGGSQKPLGPQSYGAEMARDVVRLLDHLKIPRAHLVGYSMGAFIAGYLATTDPQRFQTATFVAHHPLWRWTAADEQESEASARDLESRTPFRRLVLAVVPSVPQPSETEIQTLAHRLEVTNDTQALAAYHRGLRNLVVTPLDLAAVQMPTLAIIGSRDPSVAEMKELKELLPTLSMVVVDGAEHGGPAGVLRRREFLSTLVTFLHSVTE